MTANGWVYVHRHIFDHAVLYDEPVRFKIFLWLICEAEWKPRRGLQRGQLQHSIRFMADALRVDKKTIAKHLKVLEKEGMICREKAVKKNRGSVVTIVNYDKWQTNRCSTESYTGSYTGSYTESYTESYKPEEVKNKRKEEREALPPKFNTSEFADLLEQHTRGKTVRAYNMCIRKITKWSYDEAKLALENAIAGGWKGVFRPKPHELNQGTKNEFRTIQDQWDDIQRRKAEELAELEELERGDYRDDAGGIL